MMFSRDMDKLDFCALYKRLKKYWSPWYDLS